MSDREEPRLRITRQDRHLVLSGDFDLAAEESFAAALEPLVTEEGDIRIDLSAVSFIDSTGIRGLLQAQERLGRQGRLIIERPSASVRHLLEVSGLLGRLTVEEEASGDEAPD